VAAGSRQRDRSDADGPCGRAQGRYPQV